jgi:hypothetical protein
LKIKDYTYLKLPAEVRQAGKRYTRDSYCRIFSRKNLFATSSIKCIVCGGTEGKIYCHHKDGNPRNTAIENLEWRCPSCHRGIHPSGFGSINKWTSVNLEQSTV